MLIRDVGKIPRKKRTKEDNELIRINLNSRTLTNLCKYSLQNSSMLRMEHISNLKRLIYGLDESLYINDPERIMRIEFLKHAIKGRMEENISDPNILLDYIVNNTIYTIDFMDIDNPPVISKSEVMFYHKFVSDTLKYKFIDNSCDDFQDVLTRYKTSTFTQRGSIIKEFEDLIDKMKSEFRKVNVDDNALDMQFSLKEEEFENAIKNTYNIITNPSRRLITGMQGMNKMLGGGYESGRVYMYLGLAGSGKSLTLLNIANQIRKFNKDIKTKDPTKTPCVVLLTMENTVVETIQRLFDIVVNDSMGMENYSLDQVLTMLKENGKMSLSTGSPIDLIIKYKPNRSVNTSYLYTLCDELEDEGYEVICLIQDHVKRIRSIDNNQELRIELGDIVNEMKVFAAAKDIPVITNSHLNRDASRIIEDASRKQNKDIAKLLGKSNIGESMLMIDNLDFGIIIARDQDETQKYMAFNLIKSRGKSYLNYFAQPFSENSKIRLEEDEFDAPVYKTSIHGLPQLHLNNSDIAFSQSVNLNGFNGSTTLDRNTVTKEEARKKEPEKIPTPSYLKNKNNRRKQPIDPILINVPKTINPLVFNENRAEKLTDIIDDIETLVS